MNYDIMQSHYIIRRIIVGTRAKRMNGRPAKQHTILTIPYKPTIVELPIYSRGETEHSELSGTTNPKAQIKAIREKTEDTRVSP